jgi:hypothetical protein
MIRFLYIHEESRSSQLLVVVTRVKTKSINQ